MMKDSDRKRFDRLMTDCGIDANNPVGQGQKLALPMAFSAWSEQQLIIDELEARIERFKQSFAGL